MESVTIWDAEGTPDGLSDLEIFWSSFTPAENVHAICIPRLVESNAGILRQRYLAWIRAFGASVVQGKPIVEHLGIRPGFSAWWMSLLVEKSLLKSPGMTQAIKLFALEDCLSDREISRIVLRSGDRALASCIQQFCRRLTIGFEWRTGGTAPPRRGGGILVNVLKAAGYLLKYVCTRWCFHVPAGGRSGWARGDVLFLDYLLNVRPDSQGRSRFASNYWTALVDVLRESGLTTNWLHLCFPNASIPSFRSAKDLISRFHDAGNGGDCHAGLDHYLSVAVVFRILRDYVKIAWKSIRLPDLSHLFRPDGSALDLRPLMERDWVDSTVGPTAMWNMISLNLFEAALESLPRQRCGVYLQENMGWERAFIYAWKTSGHGRLIGVPHTTVRFWDLRYFLDLSGCRGDLAPCPDTVAVNGPWNRTSLLEGGQEEKTLVEVEALRFLFLNDGREQFAGRRELKTGEAPDTAPRSAVRSVLVCGDILESANHTLLSWLEKALLPEALDIRIVIKPHPARKLDLTRYPGIRCDVTTLPISELAGDVDFVLAANLTSAAIDAYCLGFRVIQILDAKTLNFSPLRQVDGVCFVSDADELRVALSGSLQEEACSPEPVFFLDRDLPRWRTLLELPPVA